MGRIFTMALALCCCWTLIAAAEVHDFARQGNVEKVRELITADPTLLKATDPKFFDGTPLHVAAERGKTEVVKLLVAAGADVNALDARGATPLILAGKLGAKAVITILLQANATVNITPRRQDQYPPLHAAVIYGDIELITYLLDHGADIQVRSYADGRTALHIAACLEDGTNINPATGTWYSGGPIDPATGKPLLRPSREIILLLLKRGANIEARNAIGETPLCQAIHTNQVNNAALLLEQGANLHAVDIFGRTSIFHCSNTAGVLFLVNTMKVDVNSTNPVNGETPLQSTSYPAVKRALIACGAKEDIPLTPANRDEDTQRIFSAVRAGNVAETQRLLAQNPQLVHAVQYSGHTQLGWGNAPLHEAANAEVAAVLLANGAEINRKNLGDLTPLHLAARNGNTALVCLLIERGADVNARTLDYRTPLHLAASMGKTDCVAALLAAKADPFALTFDLHTPLDVAKAKDQPSPEVIALLDAAMKR